MINKLIYERIGRCGLVATLTVDDPGKAVALAKALLAGGMDVMELTLRTSGAFDALSAVKKEVPQMLAGVGTVLETLQLERIVEIGADFAVAPGMNPKIIKRAFELGIPFAPGICTPSDIERAVEFGCKILKFFPAQPSGGMKYLKSIAAPYSHLGLKYVPLGGLNAENMVDYLSNELILAVGGSWIAPRDAINQGDWSRITENTKTAIEKIKEIRG
jgi:2-dehydro-3-deoxyphosphogluconate aldolase / (4S)-4-hydroxy-2-oxoglutarate aldolase